MAHKRNLSVLLSIVLLNYLAQIPYYFHQYYFPRHLPPAAFGSILLAATLVWFLIGYIRYYRNEHHGWGILLSFLVVQVLFYGHSVLLGLLAGGGIVAQLRTSDFLLLVIFLIGDLNFLAAVYYVWWLVRHRNNEKPV